MPFYFLLNSYKTYLKGYEFGFLVKAYQWLGLVGWLRVCRESGPVILNVRWILVGENHMNGPISTSLPRKMIYCEFEILNQHNFTCTLIQWKWIFLKRIWIQDTSWVIYCGDLEGWTKNGLQSTHVSQSRNPTKRKLDLQITSWI